MSIQTATRDHGGAEPLAPADGDFAARAEVGREARRRTPRSAHEGWAPPPDRSDPVTLIEEQATTRVPELVPIRHARMMVSPFTFYRGAALLMAADLAGTPTSGITDADLRRRAPVELRRLRHARAHADLRHQRLRRDAARPVGVGREATGGELRGRRPQSRLHRRGTHARSTSPSCAAIASGCCRPQSRECSTRWYDRLDADQMKEYITAGRSPSGAPTS